MTGTTSFPGAADDFAAASPAQLADSDSTGRTHSERHDDMEAAMEAVQGYVLRPRATSSLSTDGLAAGASEQGNLTLAAGYRLYAITTSAPARVRLYTTTAKRDADAGRAVGTDPVGDHGLMFEFVSTASLLAADLSPTVDGFDGKAVPDGAIPYRITNTGGGAALITATFTWTRTE